MPSIFNDNLFDNFMDDFAFPVFADVNRALYGKNARNLMKTDVKETENEYKVDIDLPGFAKDEIKMQLDHGYLTVSAAKGLDKEEKDGKYIRRERYAGVCSRSFYVGTAVRPEEIGAKYEDGILKLSVPKAVKKELPASTSVSIQ